MMSRMVAFAVAAFVIAAGTETAFSKTLLVPASFSSVESALSIATDGDSIFIDPGYYFEYNLVMKSGVTLTGTGSNPQQVEINAQSLGRILLCEGITDASVNNITFAEGHAFGDVTYHQSGGGIFCSYSSIEINNCVFKDNQADSHGGAIRFSHGSGNIYNCRFESNSAIYGGGGAIDCSYDSSPTLSGSYFRNNQGVQ